MLTAACAAISIVAMDCQNVGIITDYDVVTLLAELTNVVGLATVVLVIVVIQWYCYSSGTVNVFTLYFTFLNYKNFINYSLCSTVGL